jgi:RNA polymerase sigma-70 factor (ECF subfamily)
VRDGAEQQEQAWAQLMVAAQEGNARAYDELLRGTTPFIRALVRRRTSSADQVEDIVQDVFLCLFERVHTLRDPVALKAFVIAIAVRTARYEIRRARVRRWVGLSRTAELPDLRVVNADTSSQHALIHFYRALNRINERDRSAFILRFIEGMEAAEVAAALEVSVPTARRCFTRAWERITFFAQRDPFLVDYLSKLEVTSSEEDP